MPLAGRNCIPSISVALLSVCALVQSAAAYELQYRLNNTNFSAAELQCIFTRELSAA